MSEIAQSIGGLVRRARDSALESVRFLLEAGRQLADHKASIPAGLWLLWLKEHQSELGFNDRTARRLMAAYRDHRSSTTDLTAEEAVSISRSIWGNENEPSQYVERAPIPTLARFAEWARSHADLSAPSSEHERAQVLAQIADARQWLESIERQLQRKVA